MSDEDTDRPQCTVDGLWTYLHCPRRYELAHVQDLAAEDGATETPRLEPLRRALCASLETGTTDPGALVDAATDRLDAVWPDGDDRFHSHTQRRHEKRVLEATVEAYVETVGTDHARGLERLREAADGEFVGPDRPLRAPISLPETERNRSVAVESTVDYVTADGASLVGVRFVPTTVPLGLLRYRSSWEGDVAALFTDHFDPDAERTDPDAVGALLETAVVLEGLRELCDRLGLDERTCRYVLVSVADRSNVSVDWVGERVEASVDTVDLTEVFLDHHTFGMTHEHRNRTVENRLAETLAALVDGEFDPTPVWDRVAADACPDCEYAVCCADRLSREVAFDG
ncbi:hypothetical protein [Natrialbaceae archaeon AArc-T1-2]|uniref:hypothetical protein n=1 Tax=Natrialbaceae archaeon AArc-T1-2 TaxID=3053904 RepID=UPI00255AF049|nr:hypothetical protein [Natrialbaceae archaeon AArc-T1-2]WIV68594.1 hypothetical protein QQ977_07695 [Natrialbaceae archaeon AArc-T1-2]